jgi:hypothetical protein
MQQQQQLRRTGSDVGQPGVELLREQLAQVRAFGFTQGAVFASNSMQVHEVRNQVRACLLPSCKFLVQIR